MMFYHWHQIFTVVIRNLYAVNRARHTTETPQKDIVVILHYVLDSSGWLAAVGIYSVFFIFYFFI